MNVLLTSCGLETQAIADAFLQMLPKPPSDARALFIPTAANTPDAIEVLPKCLGDLLKIGIPRENITVHDLHDPIDGALSQRWDIVYLCGGNTRYLLRRINEQGFREQLLAYIREGGVVIGVSAGSIIFSSAHPGHLGLLPRPLDVHCPDEACEQPGAISVRTDKPLRLGNRQAIRWENGMPVVLE
ncbi:MAG: Type 1 glutamine amidotransferase-like domain-containing protein [Christensenellaceae bacterium]|nr:Type 1 glutamine amidotransferase-like domain-containing protein [Christensenellaceae bacterium]